MATLSPKQAANLADAVYDIKDTNSLRGVQKKVENEVKLEANSRMEAKSGAFMLVKNTTGFGLVAPGVGTLNNDLVVMLRGTASIFDGLTDGHIGMTNSACGCPVHAGFNNCFDTLLTQLQPFFTQYNKPFNTVHCVGHSLGGALATLTASWLKQNRIASDVKLYTFGSPRVGTSMFSSKLTRNIGAGNIYRVNHKTDPVAMIPIWPFSHVPNPGSDFCVDTPGSFPNPAYHKMAKYIDSVGSRNWDSMKEMVPPPDESAVKRWLDSKGVASFSVNTIRLVGAGIAYVLKKILALTGITIQAGLSTSFTILDQLANVMEKAAKVSKEIAGYVTSLIVKIMQALGVAVTTTVSLTAQFLQYVFMRFSRAVHDVARGAINLVHNFV